MKQMFRQHGNPVSTEVNDELCASVCVFTCACVHSRRGNILSAFLVNLCLLTGPRPEGFYQKTNVRRCVCVGGLGNTSQILISGDFFSFHSTVVKTWRGQADFRSVSSGDIFPPEPLQLLLPLLRGILCLPTTQTPASAWYQDCLQSLSIHMSAC